MEMKTSPRRGRLIFKGGAGDDATQVTMDSIPTSPSPPSGPMTRARAKALHDKVNSLLSTIDLGSTLDGLLLHTDTLCILRYEPLHRLRGNPTDGLEDGQENMQQKQTGDRPGATGPHAGPSGDTPGAPSPTPNTYTESSLGDRRPVRRPVRPAGAPAEPSGASPGAPNLPPT